MAESFAKKEQAKKKAKKKQDKAQKMLDRKSGSAKSTSLEDMMAYVDEFGNITDKPPVPSARKEIKLEDIIIGATPIEPEDTQRKGSVVFFDDAKGYGFITDTKTEEKLFVHSSALSQPVKQGDKVTFEKEKTARGLQAVMVQKI